MPSHSLGRVVIDARYLDAGFSGIGAYSQHLLEAMARQDTATDYHVLVHASFRRGLNVGPNFTLHPIDAAPLSRATLTALGLRVRNLAPDLFHAHCPVVPVGRLGCPVVATVHDLQPLQMPEWTGRRPWPLPWAYHRFYQWAYGSTFARAARLLAVSQATRDALAALFPACAAKTRVVLEGFSSAPAPPTAEALWAVLRERYAIPSRFVLYVGSTRPNKNLPAMLRAFARMRREAPDLANVAFVLVLAPDRFMVDVTGAIKAEGLADHVRILPQVTENERTVLLGRAAALFFVTRLEGFGFPILEAQAAGTPVLTGDGDASPEIAGQAALFVPPGDMAAQAVAMANILKDNALRERLIVAGRTNITRFAWAATARATLAAYREVFGKQ